MAGIEKPEWSPVISRLAWRQYGALAWMQVRIIANSLHARRGNFELSAQILTFSFFSALAIGPAIGMGIGAYMLVADGHLRMLALPLWTLAAMWQFFSVLAPALAGQNPDLNHLLRFPISFGSWILLYLLYGFIAPSTLIGVLWTLAIGIGVSLAHPAAWVWVAGTLSIFALFNLLLSRMILAWVERWMAQRRSREIVTGLLLLLALCVQVFNPAFHQHRHGLPYGLSQSTLALVSRRAWDLQKQLPPGLASAAIEGTISGRTRGRWNDLEALVLYALAAGGLLALRLRAESRGENLSETPAREAVTRTRSWAPVTRWLDFSGPVAAVFEKDLRYLLRSGPMLYNLASPLVMVFLLSGPIRIGGWTGIREAYALPLGLVWAFLGLTRIVCNSLGGEGQGIQFYFLAPTPLRTVVMGKNVLHLALFCMEAALIATMIVARVGWPSPGVAAITVAWILFAVPTNLAVGNVLSIAMPYPVNLARMRRGRGELGNGRLGMVAQFGVVVVGALVVVLFVAFRHRWVAVPVLLLLAAGAALAYWRVLAGVDRMMGQRMEALTHDLAKSAQAG